MNRKQNRYVFLISFVSAMGGLLFGYDWVVIGGAKIFYEPFFALEQSGALRGWAMSSALVGCLIGAVMAGAWSDRYGRKKMLITAAMLFTASAIGTGATDNFTWFIVWRIVGGLGIGIASNVSPLYIAEVSPANIRGKLVSLNQFTIVLGILAAQLANWRIGAAYTTGSDILSSGGIEWAWRWMFWAETVPAMLFLGLAFTLPESPRWLAVTNRSKEAKQIFTRIGGEQFAKQSLEDIAQLTATAEKTDWRMILRPGLRPILLLGIVMAVFQQWCGINVIFNYSHEIFSAAGYAVSDILMNIVVTGAINVLFTLIAIYTVDRVGRRPLMLFGSAGLALIYLTLGAAYYFGISGLPMLLLVVLAIACYAMTLAPVVWVVLSEIFPTRMRGTMMAVCTFFLWAASFLLTYTFPLLNDWLQAAGTFWIYGAICFAGFLFLRARCPETKGRSLEEIERQITRNNHNESNNR